MFDRSQESPSDAAAPVNIARCHTLNGAQDVAFVKVLPRELLSLAENKASPWGTYHQPLVYGKFLPSGSTGHKIGSSQQNLECSAKVVALAIIFNKVRFIQI